MLKYFRQSKKSRKISCPNCLTEQEVPGGAVSVYCKNCRRRIDIKKQSPADLPKPSPPKWKPKVISISCPHCHSLQEVLASAISAYCKNCNQRITIRHETKTDFQADVNMTKIRSITCPHCNCIEKVPAAALSCFCHECGNRINLQNYEIRGRFRGDLDTKGTVFISCNGNVEGNINTGAAIIAGRFKGEIIAEEKVEIRPSARLYGKIRTPSLLAATGATLKGHLHIGKQSSLKS